MNMTTKVSFGSAPQNWSTGQLGQGVAFDGDVFFMKQYVSGALTISPDTLRTMVGGRVYGVLIADGSNAPVVSGMVEHASSFGYLNTRGVPNVFEAWYDGSNHWYSWSQAASPVAEDLDPPSLSSAIIEAAAPKQIVLVFDEALNGSLSPYDAAWSISNSGGEDRLEYVEVSGTEVTIHKSRTTIESDVVTVSYAPQGNSHDLRDSAGNEVAAFSDQAVTNQVGAGFVRFGTATGMTEGGDAVSGWSYTGSASQWTTQFCFDADLSLAASEDGEVSCKTNGSAAADSSILGFDTVNTTGYYTGYEYGIYGKGSTGFYVLVTAGTPNGVPGTDASRARVDGDLMRLRRSGTSIFAEVSSDDGANWDEIHEWTSASTAQLYPRINAGAVDYVSGGNLT